MNSRDGAGNEDKDIYIMITPFHEKADLGTDKGKYALNSGLGRCKTPWGIWSPSDHLQTRKIRTCEPPGISRHVEYDISSLTRPDPSIHSSNPIRIQLPRSSEPRKTRQIEPPRARILDPFFKFSLDPTQIR